VPRLAEQDDIISYEGALKMDLAEGAGMVCAGSATSQHPQNLEKWFVNPDEDGYTKTLISPENTPENVKKQHPTEKQKNTKTEV